MAVTEVDAIKRQVSAQEGTNSIIYRVVYRVKVNDVNDGQDTVLAGTGVPQPNSTYAYGNDANADTKIYSRFAYRDATIIGVWYVVVEWIEERVPTDPNFVYEAYPRVVPGHRTVTEVLQKTKFVNWVDSSGTTISPSPTNPLLTATDIVTPSNSAGVPVLPGIERRKAIPTYTAQWYRRTWSNNYSDAIYKVNDDAYTLAWVDASATTIFTKTFAYRELLLVDAQPIGIRAFNNQAWLLVSLEFWEQPGGWYNDELDRGLDVLVASGDDDGFGGNISPGDLVSGVPKTRRLQDVGGRDISQPVLFDGEGKALDPQAPDNAVYLRYTLDAADEFDFDTLAVGT